MSDGSFLASVSQHDRRDEGFSRYIASGSADVVDCGVCCETWPEMYATEIEETPVCFACVRQMFTDAIKDEACYPVKWGAVPVDIFSFGGIIPDVVIEAFTRKEREYLCPPAERLYCKSILPVPFITISRDDTPCGEFLCQSQEHDGPVVECVKCEQNACTGCGDLIYSINRQHICPRAKQNRDEEAAFADLKRGRDYQICPWWSCKRKLQLTDGCNQITCACGRSLCFICGEPATADSGHWTRSTPDEVKCPKWNQPDSEHAVWLDHHPPRVVMEAMMQRQEENDEDIRFAEQGQDLRRNALADLANEVVLGRGQGAANERRFDRDHFDAVLAARERRLANADRMVQVGEGAEAQDEVENFLRDLEVEVGRLQVRVREERQLAERRIG